jgi:hypothetical protein
MPEQSYWDPVKMKFSNFPMPKNTSPQLRKAGKQKISD